MAGIVEYITVLFYFILIENMYICGKLTFTIWVYTFLPISMQKTVRPQIGLVQKNSQGFKTHVAPYPYDAHKLILKIGQSS